MTYSFFCFRRKGTILEVETSHLLLTSFCKTSLNFLMWFILSQSVIVTALSKNPSVLMNPDNVKSGILSTCGIMISLSSCQTRQGPVGRLAPTV